MNFHTNKKVINNLNKKSLKRFARGSKGFNFESTHITDMKKNKQIDHTPWLLLYSWSIKIGQWKEEFIAPIKIKKHGRKEISVFRYGLDCIRENYTIQ